MQERYKSHATSYIFYKGGKEENLIENHMLSSLLFKKSIEKPHVLELFRLCSETTMKVYVHELGF
jgi:hypothetical protein